MNQRFKLSKHAYFRLLQRITEMSYCEAEDFAIREINKSKIKLTQLLEDGSQEIAYIHKGIKYIVQNHTIVTIYTI